MKKTLTIILLTAAATNVIWFSVAGCILYSNTRPPTNPGNAARTWAMGTNNLAIISMLDHSTQSFVFSFRETGNTPTNFLATNQILLMKPLHTGQVFTITVTDVK